MRLILFCKYPLSQYQSIYCIKDVNSIQNFSESVTVSRSQNLIHSLVSFVLALQFSSKVHLESVSSRWRRKQWAQQMKRWALIYILSKVRALCKIWFCITQNWFCQCKCYINANSSISCFSFLCQKSWSRSIISAVWIIRRTKPSDRKANLSMNLTVK
jgi:hypothetical protein